MMYMHESTKPAGAWAVVIMFRSFLGLEESTRIAVL